MDQFVKHELKARYYFRYADDFIFIHEDRRFLELLLQKLKNFLKNELSLELHPNKVLIKKFSEGIDFLGYIILPHHVILRTRTKKRMFKKIKQNLEKLKKGLINKKSFDQSLQSYYGMLKHCCSYKTKNNIKRVFSL